MVGYIYESMKRLLRDFVNKEKIDLDGSSWSEAVAVKGGDGGGGG